MKEFIGILNEIFPKSVEGWIVESDEEVKDTTNPCGFFDTDDQAVICRCGYFCRWEICCMCRKLNTEEMCDICTEKVSEAMRSLGKLNDST